MARRRPGEGGAHPGAHGRQVPAETRLRLGLSESWQSAHASNGGRSARMGDGAAWFTFCRDGYEIGMETVVYLIVTAVVLFAAVLVSRSD